MTCLLGDVDIRSVTAVRPRRTDGLCVAAVHRSLIFEELRNGYKSSPSIAAFFYASFSSTKIEEDGATEWHRPVMQVLRLLQVLLLIDCEIVNLPLSDEGRNCKSFQTELCRFERHGLARSSVQG